MAHLGYATTSLLAPQNNHPHHHSNACPHIQQQDHTRKGKYSKRHERTSFSLTGRFDSMSLHMHTTIPSHVAAPPKLITIAYDDRWSSRPLILSEWCRSDASSSLVGELPEDDCEKLTTSNNSQYSPISDEVATEIPDIRRNYKVKNNGTHHCYSEPLNFCCSLFGISVAETLLRTLLLEFGECKVRFTKPYFPPPHLEQENVLAIIPHDLSCHMPTVVINTTRPARCLRLLLTKTLLPFFSYPTYYNTYH